MSGPVLLVYSDAFLAYRHSDDHPLQPARVQNTVRLIERYGLDGGVARAEPELATVEEIGLVHAPEYIGLVQALSEEGLTARLRPDALAAGFASADNPVFPNMHEASALVAGGSLVAARAVHEGRALHAFNPAGGLHHAEHAQASGFCVYNDPAVAIAWLKEQGHRVAYLDVDVHHGDGVQHLFYDDPDVLTISLHESGRYLFPGTGFTDETGGPGAEGSAVNLPLPPYTWDEPWLNAFEAVVPAVLRRFRPTVLVTQNGCDTHLLDPLAHLRGSTRIWPRIGSRVHQLAHELCEGRWVATGGGGYAPSVVPRAWTLLFAEMVERPELATEALDATDYPPPEETQSFVTEAVRRELDGLAVALGLEFSPAPLA